ncbi:MAG: pyridoxamine 5'-phosphate oxidase [Saprospiraceae bacterium]
MDNLANLRQEYKKHQLTEELAHSEPLKQFAVWFQEAMNSGVAEPNAFILATVSENGTPEARVMLLKGVDNGGFVFYTNYESDKAKDLADFPVATMCFLWLGLERQVRISGPVHKVTREESEQYFHSRPRESQIGAWVSPQSQPIPSRDFIEKRLQETMQKFQDKEIIPLPSNWGGYRLVPVEIEFWQGRPNRLHDRLLYSEHEDGVWEITRLAP